MRISKGHRELACAIFDLLQFAWEDQKWSVFVSRRKDPAHCGELDRENKRVIIYAQAHLGGRDGSMAKTLLHEQQHIGFRVFTDDPQKEQAVRSAETVLFSALDEQRRAHLEYMVKGKV